METVDHDCGGDIGHGGESWREPRRWQRKTYCLKNAVQVHEPSDLMNGSIKWLDPDVVHTRTIGAGCAKVTSYVIEVGDVPDCSTTNGMSRFWPGDWLIQFENLDYAICAPVVFEQLYEEI